MKYKTKIIFSGLTGFISAIFIWGIYFHLRLVPFTDIYLGSDRRQYCLIICIFSLLGIFIFLAGKEKIKRLGLRIIFYIFSAFFVIGLPIIFLISNGSSFRGWEWSLETFLIGSLPVLFVIFGFLVLYGSRFFSIIQLISFSLVSLYHLFLFFKLISRFGKAFSSVRFIDILIAVTLIVIPLIFALFNLTNIRSKTT